MNIKASNNYGVKKGYVFRKNPVYFEGNVTGTTIWQPDVYNAVVTLAKKVGADTIIDIGSGNGDKLIPYKKEFKFIFIDFGPNLDIIKKNIGVKGNQFINQDFEKGFPTFSESVLKKSIVVCSDVIEHMVNPDILASSLVNFSKLAPFVIISTPDRQRTRGVDHYGPPQNQTHVREWSMEELDTYLRSLGMMNHITGITRSNDYEQVRRTIAIVGGTCLDGLASKPQDYIDLHATYGDKQVFAVGYYANQGITLTEKPLKTGLKLNSNEWLAAPNTILTIGAILNDAQQKGFSFVEAQVIEIDPDPSFMWPEAGLLRQGHGLIGQLKEVRKIPTGNTNLKSVKTYPIQLTIFRKKMPSKLRLKSGISLRDMKLIDTGHLGDDYILETLVGWSILKK